MTKLPIYETLDLAMIEQHVSHQPELLPFAVKAVQLAQADRANEVIEVNVLQNGKEATIVLHDDETDGHMVTAAELVESLDLQFFVDGLEDRGE